MPNWIFTLLSKWPDFIVNFFGVLAGGLVAFWIAKWQLNRQNKDNQLEIQELLQLTFDRVKLELRDNYHTVKQLKETLANSSGEARVDLWDWAITIVNSFSFNAYANLQNDALQRYLPKVIEQDIYYSYGMLEDLVHMVRQGAAAHHFYYGYSGDKNSANMQLENVRKFSNTVYKHLDDVIQKVYEYADTLNKEKIRA